MTPSEQRRQERDVRYNDIHEHTVAVAPWGLMARTKGESDQDACHRQIQTVALAAHRLLGYETDRTGILTRSEPFVDKLDVVLGGVQEVIDDQGVSTRVGQLAEAMLLLLHLGCVRHGLLHLIPRDAKVKAELASKGVPAAVSIVRCARCGGAHNNLATRKLTQPHEAYTHWATCPANGEPIMILALPEHAGVS